MARPVVALIPPSCCGAGYFRRLVRRLGDRVECRTLELPGHGRRYREAHLIDPAAAVADLDARLAGPVDVVYGESLGAYLGLALIAARGLPVTLVAASNVAPRVRPPLAPLAAPASTADAVRALADLGGRLPDEVTTDPAVAAGAFPLVRADVLLSRALIDTLRRTTVDGDIHVLTGTGDPAATRLDAWAAHTRGRCTVARARGGHLLSVDAPDAVAAAVLAAAGGEPPRAVDAVSATGPGGPPGHG